jgi:hypothetical protein
VTAGRSTPCGATNTTPGSSPSEEIVTLPAY